MAKTSNGTKVGTLCFPGGRELEIQGKHQEWVEWAVAALYAAAKAQGVKKPGA